MNKPLELLQQIETIRSQKHLPGQHDQKTHGRGGKSDKKVAAVADFKDRPEGWFSGMGEYNGRFMQRNLSNKMGSGYVRAEYDAGIGKYVVKVFNRNYENVHQEELDTKDQAVERSESLYKEYSKKPKAEKKTPKKVYDTRPDPNTDLPGYVDYRKSLGTNVKLDRDEKADFLESLDDIHPVAPVNSYSDVKESKFGKGYLLSGTNELYDITGEFGGGTNDHPGYIAASSAPEKFGLTDKQANDMLAGYMIGNPNPIVDNWDRMFRSGMVRVREFGKESTIESEHVDDKTLRRLQRLYDENKLDLDPKKNHTWGSANQDEYIQFTAADFLSAKHVNELRPRFKALKSILALLKKYA